jgi:hypothetical protein
MSQMFYNARILRNKGIFSNESSRGFDSLHRLHFSTLHPERFTDAIEQWGF